MKLVGYKPFKPSSLVSHSLDGEKLYQRCYTGLSKKRIWCSVSVFLDVSVSAVQIKLVTHQPDLSQLMKTLIIPELVQSSLTSVLGGGVSLCTSREGIPGNFLGITM